jgi:response regulator of citrate/malate metabolism
LKPSLSSDQPVTAARVREALGLKLSSCKRFLKWAVEQGHLERRGENTRTTYHAARQAKVA